MPAWPAAPEITGLDRETALRIGLWVRDVERYHKAVQRCPNVTEHRDS